MDIDRNEAEMKFRIEWDQFSDKGRCISRGNSEFDFPGYVREMFGDELADRILRSQAVATVTELMATPGYHNIRLLSLSTEWVDVYDTPFNQRKRK